MFDLNFDTSKCQCGPLFIIFYKYCLKKAFFYRVNSNSTYLIFFLLKYGPANGCDRIYCSILESGSLQYKLSKLAWWKLEIFFGSSCTFYTTNSLIINGCVCGCIKDTPTFLYYIYLSISIYLNTHIFIFLI